MQSDIYDFFAVASGALAGWAAINLPGMPTAAFLAIYQYLGILSEIARSYLAVEKTIVLVLYHVPGVLVAALGVGLISVRVRYPTVLFLALLIWPGYIVISQVATILRLSLSARPDVAAVYFVTNIAPAIGAYTLLYALLFAVAFGVRSALGRFGGHNSPRRPR